MSGLVADVSLDIEACGEVVLSVGACAFLPTGEIVAEFYGVPSIAEQLDRGLRIDAGAFAWWLRQSVEARAAIVETPAVGFAVMAERLRAWWPDRDARCWCYPTSYDLPVLARAFERFGIRVPWKWQETMDARTLWKLALAIDPKADRVESGARTEHHALEDAKQQAEWVVAYRNVVLGGRHPHQQ